MEKSGKRPRRSRTDHAESLVVNTPSTSTAVHTPRSSDGADMAMNENVEDMQMTVEEAMGMEPDDDSDEDTDVDDDDEEVDTRQAQALENHDLMDMQPPDSPITPSPLRVDDNNKMDVDELVSPIPSICNPSPMAT